jgi:hypothetical protein
MYLLGFTKFWKSTGELGKPSQHIVEKSFLDVGCGDESGTACFDVGFEGKPFLVDFDGRNECIPTRSIRFTWQDQGMEKHAS